MKKYLCTILLPLTVFANADTNEEFYDSYTYFSFGVQNIRYTESLPQTSVGDVESEVKATSPVYISGALIRINKTFDFSMDIASTLAPTQAEETWRVDGVIDQTNQFDLMLNSMQFLGHYKITNNHRIVLGASYQLNSFNRYALKNADGSERINPGADDLLNTADDSNYGLIQERITTLYANAGYWYESSPHAKKDTARYKFTTLFGKSIYNQASNTEFEKLTFNSTSGYNIESSAYVGYPILDGLELGVFVGLSYQKKPGADRQQVNGRTLSWPENELTIWQTGLSLVWNFSKK